MAGIVQGKKNIYIYGSGGFGREIEAWLMKEGKYGIDFEITGYIDEIYSDLRGYPSEFAIKHNGTNFDNLNVDDDYILLAISNIKNRERIFGFLKQKNIQIFTFISEYSFIGKYVTIGEGTIICPKVVLSTNISIGKACIINTGTQVGHDSTVGNYCSLMSQIEIGGNVVIEDRVFIGSNATILPKNTIGENSLVGAGSVVIKKVKSNTTVFGNPAKRLK